MTELVKKDLFVCLGVWLAFEILCLMLVQALHANWYEGAAKLWFLLSLPLGVGGAFLMASSTQLLMFKPRHFAGKALVRLVSLLLSWMGLLGIAFPLFIISVHLFTTLFALLKV